MWPKAISSLIELAPHITRLVPMADRFFNAKSAEADASRTAMEQMAEGLRGDLGQVTASHAGLYRQLNDQSTRLSELAADAHATRLAADSIEARITTLEAKLSRLTLLLGISLLLISALCIIAALTLLHLHPSH
jgi:septal ring factor EnvC (AmiA/AmiB activator)